VKTDRGNYREYRRNTLATISSRVHYVDKSVATRPSYDNFTPRRVDGRRSNGTHKRADGFLRANDQTLKTRSTIRFHVRNQSVSSRRRVSRTCFRTLVYTSGNSSSVRAESDGKKTVVGWGKKVEINYDDEDYICVHV